MRLRCSPLVLLLALLAYAEENVRRVFVHNGSGRRVRFTISASDPWSKMRSSIAHRGMPLEGALLDSDGAELREIDAVDSVQHVVATQHQQQTGTQLSSTSKTEEPPPLNLARATNEHTQAEVRFRQGVVCFEKGHFEAATEAFSQALALNPEHSSAHTGKGVALYRRGDNAGASLPSHSLPRLGTISFLTPFNVRRDSPLPPLPLSLSPLRPSLQQPSSSAQRCP